MLTPRYQYFYAAQILLWASLGAAKVSVILLVITLGPQKSFLKCCHGLLALLVLWTVAVVFAQAFQCHLPRPWDIQSGVCDNLNALYLGLGVTNVVTDVALIILPVILVWGVQLPLKKRWEISGVFGVRIMYLGSRPVPPPWADAC